MLTADVLTEFKFDPRVNRYRVTSGAGKGQLISKEAFLKSTERYILKQKQELIELGSKIFSKDISSNTFQLEAAKRLKEIHTGYAILAANGAENMIPAKWGIVGNELKKQYYAGKDPLTGERYGLRYLVKDISEKNLSEAQIRDRLRKFGNMGKSSYWQILESNTSQKYAKRILGNAEHCEECLLYAARGIRPKSQLPLPTQACRCGSECKCSIIYMTLETAIKQGYKTSYVEL